MTNRPAVMVNANAIAERAFRALKYFAAEPS